MIKIALLFVLMHFAFLLPQTLLLQENFDYGEGYLTNLTSDWIESPTGSTPIQVANGSLSFPNYPSSGVGNKIVINGGASSRSGVTRAFTIQSGNNSKVYTSFLMNVTSTVDMGLNDSDGDRFFSLKVSGSSSYKCCVYVRQGNSSADYQIGFSKVTTQLWYSNNLNINTTYLIVVAYSFKSGNDLVQFWIDPILNGIIPEADIEQSTGADADNIGEIQFRQEPLGGDVEVDGIRISDSWFLAPLPVELSTFTSSIINKEVHLNWRTETEVSNYGFDVERTLDKGGKQGGWETIGFVKGNGCSNSPKEYSFVDKTASSGKYFYRLKQIDTDGKFEYSKIIEVDFDKPVVFKLEQNFPNPFNPTTKISWQSSVGSWQTLKVYDILGNEIATLFNEVVEAGKLYEVNFDASGLASGVYYYRLTGDNRTEIRKMMLIK